MFIAATSAAARSGGDAFGSHTVVFARGPLMQSGYLKASTARTLSDVAAKAVDSGDFILAGTWIYENYNTTQSPRRQGTRLLRNCPARSPGSYSTRLLAPLFPGYILEDGVDLVLGI